jgi:CheY-like chemotaxis protein
VFSAHVWTGEFYLYGKLVREAQPLRAGSVLNLAHLFFFEVHLPAEPLTGTLTDAHVERDANEAGCPRRALVVEDNEDAAATLALVLSRWGYKVWVVHSGAEALEAAKTEPPDTVLLDIRLSGMDGCQVAHNLRNQEGMEKARIVALTGYDPDRIPFPSGATGFDRLLTKPVDPAVLKEVLR